MNETNEDSQPVEPHGSGFFNIEETRQQMEDWFARERARSNAKAAYDAFMQADDLPYHF